MSVPAQGEDTSNTESGKSTAEAGTSNAESGKSNAESDKSTAESGKGTAEAGTSNAESVKSSIQSAARPFNLDIAAPVQVAGSDAASKAFQTNVLPGMLATEAKLLPEYRYHSPQNLATFSFDPSKLVLGNDANTRVYFLGEGAGYQNTLGISTTGGSPLSPESKLIFPNASSPVGFAGTGSQIRSSGEPLLPGDFVNLGTLKAGTSLDFFLIANGALGGKDIVSTDKSQNKDGIVHAVAMAVKGSSYLLISFEDMIGGGDRDYNDVFFAVDIGKANVAKISGLGAPEPSMAAGALLAGVALFGFSRRRRC